MIWKSRASRTRCFPTRAATRSGSSTRGTSKPRRSWLVAIPMRLRDRRVLKRPVLKPSGFASGEKSTLDPSASRPSLRAKVSRVGVRLGQLTLALIVLCVAVGVLSGLGDPSSPILRALSRRPDQPGWATTSSRIDWSQPWRLLTPMLIHFGILHLAFNMLWLYRLGSQIESVQGTSRVLLGLVVLTQVPGALVQFAVSGPLFGGMSGVVYGLFGFTWMQARYASNGYSLTDRDTMWIMGWFVTVCHRTGWPHRERPARSRPGLRAAGRDAGLHRPSAALAPA